MKQKRFFADAWPAARNYAGEIDDNRHKTWCKVLRRSVSDARRDGFELTDAMQHEAELVVSVTIHAGRNGARVKVGADAYRDSVLQGLLDAHLTGSTARVARLTITTEAKSSPKKLGGTTVDVTWRD